MEGPVITVDVSKGSCHYQAFFEKGRPFRKPKVLHDTIEGFADLTAIIQKVKEKSGCDMVTPFPLRAGKGAPLQERRSDSGRCQP